MLLNASLLHDSSSIYHDLNGVRTHKHSRRFELMCEAKPRLRSPESKSTAKDMILCFAESFAFVGDILVNVEFVRAGHAQVALYSPDISKPLIDLRRPSRNNSAVIR